VIIIKERGLEETLVFIDSVNREYKDSFFKKVFESEYRLIELAKFLSGADVKTITASSASTVLMGAKKNDLSFVVDEIYYYIVECQATYNPNMPLRILQYITAAWSSQIDKKTLYGVKKAKLKVPRLYTLYTGCCKDLPKAIVSVQRLTDLFEVMQKEPDIEVIVHTYDFNMTRNEITDYIENNQVPRRLNGYTKISLFWYAMFVNSISFRFRDISKKENAEVAKRKILVELCILFRERGIFVDLLSSREVIDLVIMQYSTEEEIYHVALNQGLELGLKQGIEQGIEQGLEQGIEQGIEQGLEQGIEQGIKQGIKAAVLSLCDIGVPKDVVTAQLEKRYGLTPNEAEETVAKYYP